MDVILREHIDNLGRRGDVVKVAPGYARNFLLPRKLALAVTEANKKQIERERKAGEVKDAQERTEADAYAQRLEALEIEIARRIGENNVMYGSVTSADIATALAAKGFTVDRRKIQLPDPIKALGDVQVPVKVHRDVTAQVKVKVVPEQRVDFSSPCQAGEPRAKGVSSSFAFTRFLFPHITPTGHMAETAAPERTLPHSLDAEKSVLGAILIRNEAFNHAAELIDARDFFRDAHRRIFERMVTLSERGDPIDFITLKEELSRAGELDEVGGPAYVASLADGVPRSANVEYYARIVKEKSTLRSLIHSANKILTEAYEAEQEPDLLLDEAERSIFAIAEDRIRAGFVPLRDLVQSSFATIEALQQHKGLVTGVPTGFLDLDEMTSGLQRSDLVLVAARPSMGKTSFVLNIAQHVGTATNMTVGFFSLEMSKEQLFMRLLTSEARIDAHRFRSGYLSEKDYGRLSHALGTLAEAKVFIDDTASIGVLEMRAKARRLRRSTVSTC